MHLFIRSIQTLDKLNMVCMWTHVKITKVQKKKKKRTYKKTKERFTLEEYLTGIKNHKA